MYIATLVIEILCINFLFVETKRPTLEDTAVPVDGDEAIVAGKMGTSIDDQKGSAVRAEVYS